MDCLRHVSFSAVHCRPVFAVRHQNDSDSLKCCRRWSWLGRCVRDSVWRGGGGIGRGTTFHFFPFVCPSVCLSPCLPAFQLGVNVFLLCVSPGLVSLLNVITRSQAVSEMSQEHTLHDETNEPEIRAFNFVLTSTKPRSPITIWPHSVHAWDKLFPSAYVSTCVYVDQVP